MVRYVFPNIATIISWYQTRYQTPHSFGFPGYRQCNSRHGRHQTFRCLQALAGLEGQIDWE
jgi:hypothetical protein